MLACVRDRGARSARWSMMFRGLDRRMCSCNRMMDASLSVVDADENTSSKRTASMLLRSIAPMPLTKLGCGMA